MSSDAAINEAVDLINNYIGEIEVQLEADLERARGSRAHALALGLALLAAGGVVIKRASGQAAAAEMSYAVADALAAGGNLRLTPSDFARLLGLPDDLEAA